jgi:pimeloyl-ACP methyl ester carboxylesterase|tara:strand:+ start:3798 stop:4610 length:813 start_codon:yes stop_codon:yes gene_type:complete
LNTAYKEVDGPKSPPSGLIALSELIRAGIEASTLPLTLPLLIAQAPKADGHRVLVIPGFMAGDRSTAILRRFINTLGYESMPWDLGRNNGSQSQHEDLIRNFRSLTAQSDKPITLIGQSLGGVYARELARLNPKSVRMVITLGSPFGSLSNNNSHPFLNRLFKMVAGVTPETAQKQRLTIDPKIAPPVPCTAVYSKTDGVVPWQSCIEHVEQTNENVEVVGSHIGMGFHPHVLHVIADRLGQAKKGWQPFHRKTFSRQCIFPSPSARAAN